MDWNLTPRLTKAEMLEEAVRYERLAEKQTGTDGATHFRALADNYRARAEQRA